MTAGPGARSLGVLAQLRRRYAGTLVHDRDGGLGHATTARYVLDAGGAAVVLEADAADVGSAAVLCVPEESPEALMISVDLAPLDQRTHGLTGDRWRAAHGAPALRTGRAVLATAWIQSVRAGGQVLDASELAWRNPAAELAIEGALCRLASASPGALAALCPWAAGSMLPSERARCVGADQLGIDVLLGRALARAEFAAPAWTADGLRAAVMSLVAGGAGAASTTPGGG
ncbi:MAG: hypothetical protein C0475_02905 [Planctomyces sp.]|nr:hypothetical protein [Planctomyces sp.]MBA4039402.1 hypothetical protein [Planctomyces sp.]